MWRDRQQAGWLVLAALACGGCALFAKPQEQRIIVPDDLLRQSDYAPDGVVPRSRYVVRMSDGRRDWEIEFPEVATGYELRIPLQGDPLLGSGAVDGPRITAADREILGDMARQSPEPFRDGGGIEGDGAIDGVDDGATRIGSSAQIARSPTPKVSYLATLADIRELYRTRNYEVALVKLVDLEQAYPGDEKLLSMKGSLYRQLGRTALARDAWEQVLRMNPHNEVVLQALEQLNAERGGGNR